MSNEFKRLRKLTKYLNIFFCSFGFFIILFYISYIKKDWFTSLSNYFSVFGLFYLIMLFLSFIIFLMWGYRANKNLNFLGVQGMKYSPFEAVVWLGLPIASLIGCYFM